MAAFEIPRPRSRQQTLGEMLNVFTSRYGIPRLKIGGPLLSSFEAVAQSQMRCTQDIWNLLDLSDYNRLEGTALDAAVAEEGMSARFGARPATGRVDFTDTRFARTSTRIYSGAPPPSAGAGVISVADAGGFPASGQIYVGRGTINNEGPIAYTSITPAGQYYNLNLSAPTTKFHNLNEDVVLAQGGNRLIPVGTTVGTAVDGRTAPITYSTTQIATILDGEVEVFSVPIICRTPGSQGNVPRGAITTITGAPFPGAAVTNPIDFSNATDIEQDPELRERLRAARASRSRGTAVAILYGVKGLFSSEDQKRVLSANLVQPAGEPATLYIDDGTGYEETNEGTAYEVLADSAAGGERQFAISGRRPIAKAFLTSSLQAPFALQDGAVIRFVVGGIAFDHTFSATDFVAIAAATSYEVVSSINANPESPFSARTADSGTRVTVYAREDSSEDIQCQQPSDDEIDANDVLGFSTALTFTLKLYKNDVLLYKDGRTAVLNSEPQTTWSTMATGIELRIAVDGTPAATYVFADADFVAANTGYSTVSQINSLESWATVINAKIPGITASDGGGFLVVESNLGPSGRGALEILSTGSPNFISAGVFTAASGLLAEGLNRDFTVNRITGDIKLSQALAAADTLTVGSYNTRANVSTAVHTTATITLGATARIWACIDGDAELIPTAADGSTTYTVTSTGTFRHTYTASAAVFGDLQIGDWVVVWDPVFSTHGCWRICQLPDASSFIVERPFSANEGPLLLTQGGLRFFRTTVPPVCLRFIAGSNRSLASLVDEGNTQLETAAFEVYRSTRIRLVSNAYEDGRVTILTADAEGQSFLFPLATPASSSQPHIGVMQTGNSEVGTPISWSTAGVVNPMLVDDLGGDLGEFGIETGTAVDPSWLAYFVRKRSFSTTTLYGNNVDNHYTLGSGQFLTGHHFNLRKPLPPAQIVAGANVARTASILVTVTAAADHSLAVGDIVWMDQAAGETPDGDFVRGLKIVSSVPSNTEWTYNEAGTGADGTSSADMTFNIWDGINGRTGISDDADYIAFVRPYAIGAYDNLNITINKDVINQAYDVPLYRRGRFSEATLLAQSPMDVVDVDGGGVAFSTAFGTADPNFFQDFHLYMRSRTVTHANLPNKGLIWRLNRYGPEGDAWQLRYVNPSVPDADFSHSINHVDVDVDVGPKISVDLSLPSGTARTVANLEDDTRWTWAVTPVAGPPTYDTVVFTYATAVSTSGNTNRAANVVTVDCTAPHGFTSGEIVNLVTSTDVNFPVGAKIITYIDADSFSYPETGAPGSSAASLTFSSAAAAPDLSQIVVGDVMSIQQDGTNDVLPLGAWRVYDVDDVAKTIEIRVPAGTVAAETVPQKNGNIVNLQFFPIDSAAASATLIKAYADTDMADLLTASLLGTGATQITDSTADEYYQGVANTSVASVKSWLMLGGLSWVQESDLTSAPNTLTLKLLDTAIAGKADILPDIVSTDVANEQFRLVPATARCLQRWLSSPAVSGVYASATFDVVGQDGYLQMATRTIGTEGSVAVTGGLANSLSTAILTTGENLSSAYGQVTISTAQAQGLHAGQAVMLSNTLPTTKTLGLTAANTVALAGGQVTVDTAVWASVGVGDSLIPDDCQITIHRVGKYTAYRFEDASISITADLNGCFFKFSVSEAAAGNQVESARIVAYNEPDGGLQMLTIWIENENGVNEHVISSDDDNIMQIYTQNSVQPGDTLTIGWQLGSINNQGSFVVTALGATGGLFSVDTVFVTTGATAIGANLPLFQVTTNDFRLLNRIYTIVPDAVDANRTHIVFQPNGASALVSQLNPNLGSVLTALDKLDFPDDIAAGTDGYSSSTGLIGETVRTLYGDTSSPTIYPGIAAVGSTIYVAGPSIKRIRISLQLRLRSGATASSIIDRVRAAVASEINRIPQGIAVDLSRVVRAARSVQGVASCVVLSPTYTSSDDVIPVQSGEKPSILDAVSDISVTVVGL